jgi:CDP-diacylglycerol--glycerol-3-phosphate 3-phosphatidyltransferase
MFGVGAVWSVALAWVLGIYSEISDYLDGKTARKYKEVSDFGKVFDPFADVIMHVSYFIAFTVLGLLPLAFVIIIFFREYAISLIRLLCAKDGVIMGAKRGGKIKTVSYVVTVATALLRLSLRRWGIFPQADMVLGALTIVFCCVSVSLALYSLYDYYKDYRKLVDQKRS